MFLVTKSSNKALHFHTKRLSAVCAGELSIGHMENIDSCREKGDEQMVTRMAGRFVWAVVVVMLGISAGNSFAADKALALSNAVAQVKLFADLTDAERDELKSAVTLRSGEAGERIIEQGKALGKMFVILEGQVEIRVNGKHVATHSGQILIGEIEFLDNLPACADVLLTQETDLLEIDCAALTALMEKRPRLGYVLMREIASIEGRRLRESSAE